MILNVYGVAGLGIAELGQLFLNLQLGYAVVINNQLLRVGLETEQKIVPVIFKGTRAFVSKYNRFTQKDVVCFVIDNPIELSFINLTMLSVEPTNRYLYRFTKLDETVVARALKTKLTDKYELVHKPKPVLTQVVMSFQGGSVLAPVQTFLYTIKDKGKRKAVDTAIKEWLTSGLPFNKLLNKLSKHLSEGRVEHLSGLLSHKKFNSLKIAAQKLKRSPERLASISSEFNVSSYDLRYLIH